MSLNFIEIFFIILKILNLRIILVVSPLGLGFYIFFCSIITALIINWIRFRWYSFIFFLLYVGGLLVLLFYIIRFRFKPKFKLIKIKLLKICVLLKIIKIYFFFYIKLKEKLKKNFFNFDFSKNLFSIREKIFLIFLVSVLFLVLWIITKLIFRNRMSIRFFN